MGRLLQLGDILATNAYLFPEKVGARDLTRSLTFRVWNERACKLANALLGLGLGKRDRIAVLAYNCLEWMEIYAAVAKAGLVMVPINFRLVGSEVRYIVENSEAEAVIVQDDLVDSLEEVRAERLITDDKYVHFGDQTPAGHRSYEDLIAAASPSEPSVDSGPDDPYALLYTSGTTGKPKGVIRDGGGLVLQAYLLQADWGFGRNDSGLLVMPMCHANSLYFAHVFAACGASCCVDDRKRFEPEQLLTTLANDKFTFTSLVPTHYIMMLGLPESVKHKLNVESVAKLLISSAPARKETKLALMDYFRNSRLYEAYGSTEAGWVTVLRPEEQLTKLGSIGRECLGTGKVKLLDPDGVEVADGEVGEIYSRTPYAFQGYWKSPEKTAAAFRGAYCTVGDLARRDLDGYLHLADRKSNMIISGGENIYPSEVEQVLGAHPKVKDVAAVGVPNQKWGEAVHAVIVLHQDQVASVADILDWCKTRIAGYKRPKSISFIAENEMPRTATGKVLHRVLRDRYAGQQAQSAKGRGDMTDSGNSSDGFSGVVMGKAAGAALAGERAREAAPTGTPKIDGGTLVAHVLQSQGVKYLFAVNGGHTWPILAALRDHRIKLIHMRHEQSCAYAADGWARTTATPGVCSVTAGCGLTNAVTGLCAAALAGSAVVCIAGQHPTTEDGLGSFQEAYGSEVCRSFSKFTKRVLDWSTIEVDLRQAFRDATSAPQGVALIEIPTNILYQAGIESNQRRGAKVYAPGELRSGADPQSIEQAIAILLAAKRPLIAAGDGIFWSGAAAELREFVELTNIPVYARRTGQGAVAEDRPLAIRGAWKKPFTGRADAVLAIGFRFWSGEKFGAAPTWNETARYIQADATPTRIGLHVPAEVALVGDAKLVLRQLCDAGHNVVWERSERSDWLKEIAEVRTNFDRAVAEQARMRQNDSPIHPARIARELCDVIDPDATIVIDSFTMSGWISQSFLARFPGQILDAGPLAPVGHGIGMAIGAQLARPGKQVVLIIGDGGLGVSGFDLETARRYGLPIVAVLWNNSSWGPSFEEMPFLKGRTDPFEIQPNQRYDRMFELMDCHGEYVERPEEFRPALERALKAGRTALVNVVGNRAIGHPSLGGNLLGSTRV